MPPNNSDAADQFRLVANEFCSVVDAASNLNSIELLLQIYKILPPLIAGGMTLPDLEHGEGKTESTKSRVSHGRSMTDADWKTLYQSLKEKFGSMGLYWEVWDPTKFSEPIQGSLADDLADIYRDVKKGLNLREAEGASPDVSICDWRVTFYSHWGKHAIDALRAIHFLLEDNLS